MMYQMNMKSAYPRRPMPSLLDDPIVRRMMGVEAQRCSHGMRAEAQRRSCGMRVDVQENGDAYILTAELPGVKLTDITLTTEDDVLTIAADVNLRKREERDGYVMRERRSGHVERRFSLEGIRQEGITAASEDGVLTVLLPKEKPEGPKALRHIPIASAEAAPAAPALPAGDACAEE